MKEGYLPLQPHDLKNVLYFFVNSHQFLHNSHSLIDFNCSLCIRHQVMELFSDSIPVIPHTEHSNSILAKMRLIWTFIYLILPLYGFVWL
jgi:hypothetical protein